METTLKEIINNEIKWCKENRDKTDKSKDFQDGFIKGLKQALFLVKLKLTKTL